MASCTSRPSVSLSAMATAGVVRLILSHELSTSIAVTMANSISGNSSHNSKTVACACYGTVKISVYM